MQKAALLQATQINIARFCVLTRLFYHAFWNFSIAQPKKVFAEITVRNNLDFGYTAGAVNSADAYEKNSFQQKCYINFLWLSRFLFLPDHNAMQEEASPGIFLITTAA